jgi:hypothetical protein
VLLSSNFVSAPWISEMKKRHLLLTIGKYSYTVLGFFGFQMSMETMKSLFRVQVAVFWVMTCGDVVGN